MGQTAIISPQIVDSTSIGRDLITAADQAAAQAIIGVTGVDTGADYTWTGNHQFDEPVELLSTDWADANGVINQPDINGFHYLAFNSSNVFRASALDFIPMTDGTKNLGRSDLRFADVFSVDGDFSGTLSAVTVAGQTNTLLLRSNGGTSNISLSESGAITLTAYGNIYQQFTLTGVNYREDCIPTFNGTLNLGLATNRWANVASVDGSFSGSLNSEAGGSYKLYNLGAEGDTDSEALVISADGTTYDISSTTTGTGAHRRIDIGGFVGTAFRGIRLDTTNGVLDWQYNNATKFRVDLNTCKISSPGTVVNDLRPNVSGASYNGTSTYRWSNVASVDGDFSGDVAVDGYITGGASGHAISLASTLLAESQLRTSTGGGTVFAWGWSGSQAYSYFTTTLFPSIDNNKDLGMTTNRWRTAYLYDGSFSGNLISETGGSYKLYNLGTEGDADTEYLETSWNVSNTLRFDIKSTGTGVVRNLNIYSGGSYLQLNNSNSTLVLGTTASQLNVDNSYFRFNKTLYGSTTGVELGTSGFRFGNVYSVDGDFSGNMTLSNLPTSDPAVAGQLWNDSGTVKISAG